MAFKTKDSGKREEFQTGMVRDTQDDKPRYDLIDGAFLRRWAELMARGAVKYGEDNWRKASTEEELKRFKASAVRHLFQFLEGDRTEDHAAAVAFNLAGACMVEEKLKKGPLAF
jgi:dATP/dGTP diphosphohydrolase